MFDTEEGKRKVALSLTHYIYRNTRLEDYHSAGVEMDGGLYKKIYATVYAKLKNVKLLHKYIAGYPRELKSVSDFEKLMDTVPERLRFKFQRYLDELLWGIRYPPKWDEAKPCAPPAEGQGAASYVLGGKFAECCKEGCVLDDGAMRNINKDVHDRIYTLLKLGCFD